MIKNNKLVFSLGISALLVGMAFCRPVAAYGQYYSQGETKNKITVDKKLRHVYSDSFMDNIPTSTKVFVDGDIVEFQIKVENNSQNQLKDFKVTDVLPSNLSLIFYPGQYNRENNQISWTIEKLDKGESKQYYIRARIVGLTDTESKYEKRVNTVEVKVAELTDKDEASFFVAKKIVPVTGWEDMVGGSVLTLTVAIVAFGLRKAARGY